MYQVVSHATILLVNVGLTKAVPKVIVDDRLKKLPGATMIDV